MAKTIIVAIHGILTRADEIDWEEDFGDWLGINHPEIQYIKFKYGWIDPVRSWLSTIIDLLRLPDWINNLSTQKFTKALIQLRKDNPDAKIHIVSHSYGTWVTWRTLVTNPTLKIQSVSFVAGVISAHIEKNGLGNMLMAGQVKSVFVWCSHSDVVVRFIAVPPYGHIGWWGIIRDGFPEDRGIPLLKPYSVLELYNRLTDFVHDGYFVNSTFKQILKDINYAENIN